MDKVRLFRRVAVEIVIFAVLVSLTALILRPIEGWTRKTMGKVRDSLVSGFESALRRNISYASASPSIVGSVDIKEFSLYRPGEEPALKLARFRLGYSIGALIGGRGAAAIRSVTVEGLELVYDLDRDQDLAALLTDRGGGGFSLPEECLVQVLDGSILVKKNDNSLKITGIAFDGRISGGRIAIDGSWHTEAALAAGNLNLVKVDGGISGDFSRDFSEGSLLLNVSALKSENFEIGNLLFDLSLKENKVLFTNLGGNFGLQLVYDQGTGSFSGEFDAAGEKPVNGVSSGALMLGSILTFTGDWKRYDSWLEMVLAGSGSFNMESGGGIRYRFDIGGTGGNPLLSSFILKGDGDGEVLNLERCEAFLGQGSLRYSGDLRFDSFLPDGVLRFSRLGFSPKTGLSGNIRLARYKRNLSIFGENFYFGEVPFSSVSGSVNVSEDWFVNYRLELLRSQDGKARDGVEVPSLSLSGSWEPAGSQEPAAEGEEKTRGLLEGSIALESFSLADIVSMAEPFFEKNPVPPPVRALLKNAAITTGIFAGTDFSHIFYSAPRAAIHEGLTGALVGFSLSGTEQRFDLTEGKVSWKTGELELELQADFSKPGGASFFLQTGFEDFVYYFEGLFENKRSFTLRGSYGFQAIVSGDEASGYRGSINAASLPLPFRGHTAHLNIDSSLEYRSSLFWNLDINRFQFRETENSASQFINLQFSGRANQEGFETTQLLYGDRFGDLSGAVRAEWVRDFSSAAFLLSMDDEKNDENGERPARERYLIEAQYQTDEENAAPGASWDIELSGAQLERFSSLLKNSRLSGVVNGTWNEADSYSLNFNIDSLEISAAESVSLSASGLVNPWKINAAADIRWGELSARGLTVFFDRSASSLALSGQFGGSVKGRPAGLVCSLRSDFAPVESWFGMAEALRSFSGRFDVESAYMGNVRLSEPCSFVFSRIFENSTAQEEGRSSVRVSGGPDDMLDFELLGDGSLYLDLAYPSPLRGTITGTMNDFILDVQATDVFIDLPLVWALIPMKELVVFTGGFITGETRIRGSLRDPEFSGTAWGSSVRLTVPAYVGAEIGPGSGEITLEGSEISFGPIWCSCGNGYGDVSVAVTYNRWVPSFVIGVRVPEPAPIPVAFDVAGVNARGDVSGFLNFALDNSELITMSGDLYVENTEVTLNAEEIEALREKGRNAANQVDVAADLTVTAGRRVEFIWPSEDFPILRAYGAPGGKLRIISDSRTPQFSIEGDIPLQGGEIFYFQRSFFIREGEVFFSPNDDHVDPYISARAEIRDQYEDGPVIIALIIDYSRLSALTPRFESTPALSQVEIYSLLGQTPAEGEQSEVMLRSLTDILAQFAVVRRVERGIRDALHLDMFTVRTQVLQNVLMQLINPSTPGGESAASGYTNPGAVNPGATADGTADPARDSSVVGNLLDNTAVFMGKYVGPDMFVQARLALRYDQFREEFQGLRPEPEIGLDLRSPLANIRWSVNPKNFEKLTANDTLRELVTNQSLSLIWRWTF